MLSVKEYAIIAWLILLWAVANVMQLVLERIKAEQHYNWIELLANLFIASFGGMIAGLIAQLIINDFIWICVCSWMWWYAWVQGLGKIKDVFIDVLIKSVKK